MFPCNFSCIFLRKIGNKSILIEQNNLVLGSLLLHSIKQPLPGVMETSGQRAYSLCWPVFNRPGLARAVLQSPPSLID